MALSNNTELLALLEDWAARNDIDANIVDCVKLAEGDMNALLKLENAATATPTTMTANNTATTFDTSASIIRSIHYAIAGIRPDPLQYVAPENFALVKDASAGKPWFWTLRAAIEWARPPDQAYAIVIDSYPKLTIATSSTNWLLTNFPNAYVAGAMMWMYGGPLADSERAMQWKAAFDVAIAGAKRYISSTAGRHEAVIIHPDLPSHMGAGGYNIYSDE